LDKGFKRDYTAMFNDITPTGLQKFTMVDINVYNHPPPMQQIQRAGTKLMGVYKI
jgi:hypothetical protein